MDEDNELYLTNIVFIMEKNIIEAIHELSASLAEGPDGIPSSLLVNCSTEQAPLIINCFYSLTLFWCCPPLVLTLQQLLLSLNQVTGQLQVTTASFSLTSIISKVLERIIRKTSFLIY